MRADECRLWRERIGALGLGRLPEQERVATEAHLDGCPACRAEAEALAPVVALLSRADPERLAPPPAPPPRLGERITHLIASERRAERRRRRTRLGLGLAGATAAAAVLIVVTLVPSPESTPSQEVAFSSLPRGVSIDASLTPRPWGSDINVQVRGFHPGTPCRVWLRRSDGTRVPAGSFRYVYAGESDEAELSSALAPDDATAIGLRAGAKTFVAPLASRSTGAGVSWIPTTGGTS